MMIQDFSNCPVHRDADRVGGDGWGGSIHGRDAPTEWEIGLGSGECGGQGRRSQPFVTFLEERADNECYLSSCYMILPSGLGRGGGGSGGGLADWVNMGELSMA